MAAKQLVFSEEARRKLKNGMNVVANAVGATLGPKGRNVAIDRKFGSPTITHDGVSVAKEIELEDPFENMGAQLLKEAATKTNDIAGDGTTTSTVLAHAIVNEGLKALEAGYNPMLIKHGIEQATEAVVEELRKMSVKIDTKEEIASVATNSAADPEIGELIADVMDKVGKDGVITVEESKSMADETEFVEGMQFDRGYLSAYFITNADKMEAVISDAYILINEKKISAAQDIVPLLEKLVQVGKRELVIIAEDIDGEALATLVLNKLRGMLNVTGRQGPWLWRPPQGHAAGYRHPDRRHRDLRRDRPQARDRHHPGPGPRREGRLRQGEHHHHRRQGHEGRHRRPHQGNPCRDRQEHQRLRQGKTAGTPGQAQRRRRHHPRRRSDRDRNEGKEAPRRRCALCGPRGCRRRHRPRRRDFPHQCHAPSWTRC